MGIELPTVRSIAARDAIDCANDDFDILAIEGRVGYGPVFPAGTTDCADPESEGGGAGEGGGNGGRGGGADDKTTTDGASRPAMGVVVMAAFASVPLAVALAM